jgi:hypothetical protein
MEREAMGFKVRVRERTYLWGGPGVTNNYMDALLGPPILCLSFRSERSGEIITYTQEKFDTPLNSKNRIPVTSGQLNPGECFTLRLNDSCSVYADILPSGGVSTVVHCSVFKGD